MSRNDTHTGSSASETVISFTDALRGVQRYLEAVRAHKWLVIGCMVATGVIGGIYSASQESVFESHAEIVLNVKNPMGGIASQLSRQIRSDAVLREAALQLAPQGEGGAAAFDVGRQIGELRSNLVQDINVKNGEAVISLSLRDNDPQSSVDALTAITDACIRHFNSSTSKPPFSEPVDTRLSNLHAELARQQEIKKRIVEKIGDALPKSVDRAPAADVPEAGVPNRDSARYRKELAELILRQESLQMSLLERKRALDKMLSTTGDATTTGPFGRLLESLFIDSNQQQLEILWLEISSLSGIDHMLDRQIKDLQQEPQNEKSDQQVKRQQELQSLRVLDWHVSTQISTLQMDIIVATRYKDSSTNADITERPVTATHAVSTSFWHTLSMSIFAGLIAGFAGVFILDQLDDRFRSPQEVERLLGAPVAGTIPKPRQSRIWPFQRQPFRNGVDRHLNEAFDEVRAALVLSQRPTRRVAVTSSEAADGKTSVALHLARAFARSGRRTLLIDGDLRSGQLSRQVGPLDRPGLSTLLQPPQPTSESFQDIVTSSDQPGLDFLPSGRAITHAVELLSSPRLAEVLAWAETEYDQLVIDAPAASQSSDAAIIGRLVDGVLLVLECNTSDRRTSIATRDRFVSFGCRILGVVVSGLSRGTEWYSHRGYSRGCLVTAPPAVDEDSAWQESSSGKDRASHLSIDAPAPAFEGSLECGALGARKSA